MNTCTRAHKHICTYAYSDVHSCTHMPTYISMCTRSHTQPCTYSLGWQHTRQISKTPQPPLTSSRQRLARKLILNRSLYIPSTQCQAPRTCTETCPSHHPHTHTNKRYLTKRSGRIGRARASRAEGQEFESKSSQTNYLQIGTCPYLAWCSVLLG